MSSSRWHSKKSRSLHPFEPRIVKQYPKSTQLASLKFISQNDQEAALAPSTRKKYMCAWRSFFLFCPLFEIPFSPVAENLCFYVWSHVVPFLQDPSRFIYLLSLICSVLNVPTSHAKQIIPQFFELFAVARNNSQNL